MSGIAVVVVKIMPESPSSNLKHIEEEAKKSLVSHGAQSMSFEIQEVAFGLKSITIKMAWPEDKGTDLVETLLSKIEHVSSVQILDFRRAFG